MSDITPRRPEHWTIKAARDRIGMSREAFAAELSAAMDEPYSYFAVGRIERGERDINVAELRAICAILNVSPAFIIYGDGPIANGGYGEPDPGTPPDGPGGERYQPVASAPADLASHRSMTSTADNADKHHGGKPLPSRQRPAASLATVTTLATHRHPNRVNRAA